MCKVVGFSDFSKVKKKLGMIEYISQLLLETERDGFGYSIWDKNAKAFFGERTNNSSFSSAMRDVPGVNFDFCESPYAFSNKFGSFDLTNVGAAIFHGRTSTNNKSLPNVHPIVKHGWSLIHNGVVTDHGEKYETITSNDSEHVLERYVDGSFEKTLSGYYAFLALDPTGKLHVVKDNRAFLKSAWVDELGSYIFSTNEGNLTKICSALGVQHSVIRTVRDNQLLVLKDNTIVEKKDISPMGSTWQENQHSHKSLGYSGGNYWRDSGTPKGVATHTSPTTGATGSSEKVIDLVESAKKKKKRERKEAISSAFRSLTPDEVAYMQEVAMMDESYTVVSSKGRLVDISRFKEMDFSAQMHYEVVRPDGTIVDWVDYETDRLSSWNI